jgi:hypothetical protein
VSHRCLAPIYSWRPSPCLLYMGPWASASSALCVRVLFLYLPT